MKGRALETLCAPKMLSEGHRSQDRLLSAPHCAEGGLQEAAPIEQMLDDAALYAVLRHRPDMSQRGVLEQLVPVTGRSRALASIARGTRTGWVAERPGARRARCFRVIDSAEADVSAVDLLVGALEHLQAAGVLPSPEERRRLARLSRAVAGGPVAL